LTFDGTQIEDYESHLFSNTEDHTTSPTHLRTTGEFSFSQELAELPSDAFSSPPREIHHPNGQQRLVAPQNGLHQTTLFGGRATQDAMPTSQTKVRNYRVDREPEAATHHALDLEAIQTWVYPTNLGAIRDYQYSIVKNGLFNNMLVALPTGLGKTFIAATIMLNYFRWTKDAKIVFMAPTKPLVSQQVDACFNIAGIPRSTTTMLTGETVPAVRAEEWAEKRVFFMTPQTLDNDLRTGIADPRKIVLLVVDEAHRATGNYSYVKVVEFMRRFSKSFRVLALTATPGSSVEAVQEVIDGLEISKVEIRTEESIDIQQFVHRRQIDQILLDPSDEIIMIKDLLSKALQPLVDLLCGQNAYYNKDPMSLTAFGLVKAQKAWFASEAGRRASFGLKGMMKGLFAILASIAHGIKLLNFHGIGPFWETMKEFRTSVEEQGSKAGKYRKQINDSPYFKKLMDRIQLWINRDGFVGHPKLTYLCETILNHFMDAGHGIGVEGQPPSGTRVIVFAEYRDSAEEIARILNRHGPMIRASVFVGQADSKRSAGMNQNKQIETIQKFKTGVFNVIVATSIGEEGLDIGQVDLIVCYDASSSPIRMLQRMGRTGRKRAGNIVLLLMRGKEEDSFVKAKDNYEQMQKMISSGERFNFRFDLSTRIVPRNIIPVVDKRHVDIPIENTQDPSLPEPRRRASKAKKRPPKKFNMPDGVDRGFQKASHLGKARSTQKSIHTSPPKIDELSQEELLNVQALETVLLSPADERDLERRYLSIQGGEIQEVGFPDLDKHPGRQRMLSAGHKVSHGRVTKRVVKALGMMHNISQADVEHWKSIYAVHGSIGSPPHLSSPTEPLPESSEPDAESERQTVHATKKISKMGSAKNASRRPVPKSKSHATSKHRAFIQSQAYDSCSTSAEGIDEEDESATDLSDFIVHDEDPVRSTIDSTRSSSLPASSAPMVSTARKKTKDLSSGSSVKVTVAKPFFEPTQFIATQESDLDEDMPDLAELMKSRRGDVPPDGGRENRELEVIDAGRRKRRRIVESDSDE
jgi:ATP-dependent DNA helicase MPH1